MFGVIGNNFKLIAIYKYFGGSFINIDIQFLILSKYRWCLVEIYQYENKESNEHKLIMWREREREWMGRKKFIT